MIVPTLDRSHAPRGNASGDAPRHDSKADAERPGRHSHAERGNDQPIDQAQKKGLNLSPFAFPRVAQERSSRYSAIDTAKELPMAFKLIEH
ncbi:MAG: hypothetical protein ABI447_30025, partial [Pseudomonas sp.]